MWVLQCDPGSSGASRPSLWIVSAPTLMAWSAFHVGTWMDKNDSTNASMHGWVLGPHPDTHVHQTGYGGAFHATPPRCNPSIDSTHTSSCCVEGIHTSYEYITDSLETFWGRNCRAKKHGQSQPTHNNVTARAGTGATNSSVRMKEKNKTKTYTGTYFTTSRVVTIMASLSRIRARAGGASWILTTYNRGKHHRSIPPPHRTCASTHDASYLASTRTAYAVLCPFEREG